MVPPRVPQFNWVDLGLPSGTLWLDRMVGAPSPTEAGLFYQWGDVIGHSLAEGYEFNSENYTEKGLDLISSSLDNAHDAARAYYGPEAKMPDYSQLQELVNNCVISDQGDGVFLITSNINGHSMKIRGGGYIDNLEQRLVNEIRAWTKTISSETHAYSLHAKLSTATNVPSDRTLGYNIMAIHS